MRRDASSKFLFLSWNSAGPPCGAKNPPLSVVVVVLDDRFGDPREDLQDVPREERQRADDQAGDDGENHAVLRHRLPLLAAGRRSDPRIQLHHAIHLPSVSTGHAGRRRAEWQAGERKLVMVELTADDWDAQKIPPTFRRGRAAKFAQRVDHRFEADGAKSP